MLNKFIAKTNMQAKTNKFIIGTDQYVIDVVTGDDLWTYYCDFETKLQSIRFVKLYKIMNREFII